MLSGTAEYALRAVVYLAQHQNGEPVRASDLAEAVNVPRNYLGKILHELGRTGVLTSTRGKNGGFRLAVPANQVPLIRVIEPFDRIGMNRRCLLGRPECSDDSPCPMHDRWKHVAEEVMKFFQLTTVADVLGRPIADAFPRP